MDQKTRKEKETNNGNVIADRRKSKFLFMGWSFAGAASGNRNFYTINLKFIQVRKFKEGMKRMFGNFSLHGKSTERGLSSFQALATAIAAQVGTGNIAGAATAIASGGPGAIFWMWVSAFFGMATIYGEAVMAQLTRKKKTEPS